MCIYILFIKIKFSKMNKLSSLLLVLMFAFAGNINAQTTPNGIWKTIDDVTGEAKSHLEIYEQDGKFFAKIVKLLQKPEDTVCDKCKGDKKDKPLMATSWILPRVKITVVACGFRMESLMN